jgi:uncharacterized YigZ family protein
MDTLSKDPDIYYTIGKAETAEVKVKASKFVASASPVSSKVLAIEFLNNIKTKFHDASHNCFAYRIGKDGLEFRISDDGEPSGTGGKPILFSINKFKISDVIVVVTRYFGGKKLGVAGLARAYANAADEVLKSCKIIPVFITTPVKIQCVYEDLDVVKKIISEKAVSFEEKYHDSVEIVAHVLSSKADNFVTLIIANTKGRAGAEILNMK